MIDAEKNNSPLDLSYLRDMSGDSAEFMIEMIDMFKSQTPLYITDLEQSIAAGDWDKAAGYAHKIKPTLSYVGREDARGHLQLIENTARDQKDLSVMPQALREFTDFAQILYRQLDEAKAELEKRL
ncbi:Hpt domain-containing protein [Pedobacter hartonius]|uniref:HPt (Histidine-containing phosphotransfer) domain-containing protein n=1 Tax=Pedobacter hartonius TaxID=425514 RepID=A0A1H4GIK3_9SPHI|nr:Hpt domain-containing protein [Pedobacter hartonius]SEB08502.1 HPt (histidine-containing phosphotransfer) domain-containing protein [Pedobacter hartonius]